MNNVPFISIYKKSAGFVCHLSHDSRPSHCLRTRISNVEAHADKYTNEPHAPKRMKPHEYNYAGIYRCLVSLFGFQSCEVWNLGRQDVSVNAFSIYVCSHPLSGREQRKGKEFPGINAHERPKISVCGRAQIIWQIATKNIAHDFWNHGQRC